MIDKRFSAQLGVAVDSVIIILLTTDLVLTYVDIIYGIDHELLDLQPWHVYNSYKSIFGSKSRNSLQARSKLKGVR